MHDLEHLAAAEKPGATRELIAMQALARELMDVDTDRLRPLKRSLHRDLDAALAGKAAPWSEARTRFEARKLARLASAPSAAEAQETEYSAEPAVELTPEEQKSKLLGRLALALIAAALWAIWIVSLRASGPVAWDGGTGPAQATNLFTLYAPAVLALLATLIAVDSLGNSPNKASNAAD